MLEQILFSQQVIQQGLEYSGRKILTTSFGIQSGILLHLLQQHIQDGHIDLVFIDTLTLHDATYEHKEHLEQRLGIKAAIYKPLEPTSDPEQMFQNDETHFLRTHKHEPLSRMLLEKKPDIWFSGRRRSQTDQRTTLPAIDQSRSITKVHPIIEWSDVHIYRYQRDHDLPLHPLMHEGATRVGQRFETIHRKTECGIHQMR